MVLAERVYQMVGDFPADERYGLSAQLKRAAVSVPSCIAEGNARASIPDYLRFLSMASGSLAEIHTQTLLAERLGLGLPAKHRACLEQHEYATKLLKGLQNGLRQAKQDASPKPSSPFPIPHSRPGS